MAGLRLSRDTLGQFAAIARVRWQLFVNSLRTTRGTLELASKPNEPAVFAIYLSAEVKDEG